MALITISLIIIAYIVGWKWGNLISPIILETFKWIGYEIIRGVKKLWVKVFKKN